MARTIVRAARLGARARRSFVGPLTLAFYVCALLGAPLCILLRASPSLRSFANAEPFASQGLRSGRTLRGVGDSALVPRSAAAGVESDFPAAVLRTVPGAPGTEFDDPRPFVRAPEDLLKVERDTARSALLTAIGPLNRGFTATESERAEVTRLIKALAAMNPSTQPTAELGGKWTLLYTDAPDIIGIPTGPFANLRRIGQEIDPVAGTIANVIEYEPSPIAVSLLGGARDDALVQRVFTEYEAATETTVDLRIRGLGLYPERILGLELPEALRLEAKGPLSLPFGRFTILYLDDDLRIVQTAQGWYSVNRRGV